MSEENNRLDYPRNGFCFLHRRNLRFIWLESGTDYMGDSAYSDDHYSHCDVSNHGG